MGSFESFKLDFESVKVFKNGRRRRKKKKEGIRILHLLGCRELTCPKGFGLKLAKLGLKIPLKNKVKQKQIKAEPII